jgi:predicted transcriptional regulator of viral defense system
MREELQPRPVDAAIATLAARQHGVVSYLQLVALGLSRRAIDHRVRAGRLHRIHRGVYAVGHNRLSQHGRWMAAVLVGGEGAVLSHRSAAALWQLLPARGEIHVTTARALRKRKTIRFHCQSLQVDEVTSHDGIATTTAARTLVDIAATDPGQFERAFNEAEFRRLHDGTGLLAILSRNPTRRGAATIRAVLERKPAGVPREELERRFLALIEGHAIPRPELNADLELAPGRWIKPDCVWRRERLIVELDSRAAHETTSRFDSDRERDRLLARAGWTAIRVTWKHVTVDAEQLATDLRELIATRR